MKVNNNPNQLFLGYMRITDLGIARVWNPDNAKDTSGTPGYMGNSIKMFIYFHVLAPEVMCRQNHGVAVDYFAVGVIGYECMFGKRPYIGKNRKEIRDHILSKQIQIRKNEVPQGWTLEAADFINKLIQRKPINRLGLNGPQEVKEHVWFKDYNWDDLLNRKFSSPFIPPKEDNFDAKYTNSEWKDNSDDQMRQNSILLRRNSVQALFNGYYHDEKIVQNKDNGVIEEHNGPSVNSSTTNEISNNNSNTNIKKASDQESGQSSQQLPDFKDSSRRQAPQKRQSNIRQDSFAQI